MIGFLVALFLRKRKKEKAVVVSPAELASGDTPAARAAISAANAQQGLAEQLAERDDLQEKSDAQDAEQFQTGSGDHQKSRSAGQARKTSRRSAGQWPK
jgi:hypothetical protein